MAQYKITITKILDPELLREDNCKRADVYSESTQEVIYQQIRPADDDILEDVIKAFNQIYKFGR